MNLVVSNPLTNIDFESYYNLRWKILREPLGGDFSSCFDQYEFNSYHAICRNINDDSIITLLNGWMLTHFIPICVTLVPVTRM